jgi:hypothetical protein
MSRVKEFHGGLWLVDLSDLYSVTTDESSGPIGEMLERREADAVAATYDDTHPGHHASVVSYADCAQLASICAAIVSSSLVCCSM